MPGKIRVHELAKELGLTNQETLDLCIALSIGVKSHSSSIVEAQADRVRRRAERDGLLKPPPPPEPVVVVEPEPKAPEPLKPVATKTDTKKVAVKAEAEPSAPDAVSPAKPAVKAAEDSKAQPAVAAEIAASHKEQPVDPAAAVKTPAAEPTAAKPKLTISSSGSVAPAKRPPIQEPQPVAEEPPPKPAGHKVQTGAAPPRPLRSGTPPSPGRVSRFHPLLHLAAFARLRIFSHLSGVQ